jgi:dihydrofolate reductase
MRKLFWQMNVTLDGLIEGPHHELDYTAQFPDPDFDRYASEMLQSIDGILLGRRTYELFAGYWPAATGPDADRLNELPKTVFSGTLKSLQWNNSRLVSDNVVQEVERLKRESGKELALFGSADLGYGDPRGVPGLPAPGARSRAAPQAHPRLPADVQAPGDLLGLLPCRAAAERPCRSRAHRPHRALRRGHCRRHAA